MKGRLIFKVACLVVVLAVVAAVSGFAVPGQAADKKVLRLAHVYAPDHPFNDGMKEMAERIKERTNGTIEIQVFPAGQLGSEEDIAESVSQGIIQMAIVGPGELGKRYTPVLVFDGPYTFRGVDHALKVARGEVGRELWDALEEKSDIRVLDVMYYGTRYVTTSKVPVRTPEDLKGLKMRVPNQPMSIAIMQAFGAKPTPMALSEVYLALQQGVVDGQENPLPTIVTQKFNEVQKYLSLTGHVIQMTPIVINSEVYAGLSDEEKRILEEEARRATDATNQKVLETEKQIIEEIKASGQMEVIEPDIEAFRRAAQQAIDENIEKWGRELYQKIQSVK